jgi:putative transposase
MDFVHDQLATGRKLRVLTIVDIFSRFSPAVDPRFSYRGEDVVLTLERMCKTVGYPKSIRVDQGSEFISRDLDIWAYQRGVVLDFSRPGCPSADDLRLIRRFEKGGSGSSGLEFKLPAADAASGGLRWFCA